MPMFKVTIRIHPMVRQALGSSVAARLPDRVQLGDLVFTRDGEQDLNATVVDVAAETGQAALEIAVQRVREVLFVLATRGDAYEIELWPMPTLVAASAPPMVTNTSEGAIVAVDAVASATGHVGVVVGRADYTKQAAAVASSEVWPPWLRVALELNYLGETAREDRPALVTEWSALEVVVHCTQGTPRALVNAVLGEEAAAEIRKEMLMGLEGHGLDATQAERMTAQAMNAHMEGTLDRTRRTLDELGLAVTSRDLKKTGKVRGSVVHAEHQPSDEEVRQALDAVRT